MSHSPDVERRTVAADSPFDVLIVRPKPREGAVPAVMVLHDITGNERDIVASLATVAARGYLAVAPLMFTAGTNKIRCIAATMRSLALRRGPTFDVLDLTRAEILDDPECNGELAVLGFCMGGGFALLEADHRYVAAASFYGYLTAYRSMPDRPCPVVASFGGRDPLLPLGERRLRSILDARHVDHDVKTYPAVGHSFANRIDGVPEALLRVTGFGYDEDASVDAWNRVFTFLSDRFTTTPKPDDTGEVSSPAGLSVDERRTATAENEHTTARSADGDGDGDGDGE